MTEPKSTPQLKPVGLTDIVDSVGAGLRDFRRAPKFGLFFAGLFVAAGWFLVALLWKIGMPYFAYPLAMGFALVAPFAAVGFYVVSDYIERDKPLSWSAVFGAVRHAGRKEIRWMAVVTGFSLVIWMDLAAFLLFAFTSFQAITTESLTALLATPAGWLFAFLGHAVGAAIAFAVFSISAISFPLLYDRDVDFVTAMSTSVKLVMQSPRALIAWYLFVAIAMILGLLTAFFGLFLVMPIIGHTTWHLYRRAIAPIA
jgi:uncharacterized membrane protein